MTTTTPADPPPTYLLLISYDISDDPTRADLLKVIRRFGETMELSKSCYAVWTTMTPRDAISSLTPSIVPPGTETYNVMATTLTATPEAWSYDARANEYKTWIWTRLGKKPPPRTYADR